MAKTTKKTAAAAETTEKKAAGPKAAKPAAEKKTAAATAEKKSAAPAAEKKAAAKAPAKKAATKSAAPAAHPAGVPMIDTNLAAQSAAAMLRNRAVLTAATQTGDAPKAETSAFKNLKDQLAKPKSAGLGNLLGPATDAKKSTGHFFNQQKGHNQTAGGFNKTGVPRRTNG